MGIFKVLAVTFAAVALMGASTIRKGVPVYAEEAHCKADLADLYRLHTDLKVVPKRTPGSSRDDEETTVVELLQDLERLNEKRCIRIPTWSDSRFPGHWYPATSAEVEKVKDECEHHVDSRSVGSYCTGYTTTKVEHSWSGTQCRAGKPKVVSRMDPGVCTSDGVAL